MPGVFLSLHLMDAMHGTIHVTCMRATSRRMHVSRMPFCTPMVMTFFWLVIVVKFVIL
jgi:hypothetical protein